VKPEPINYGADQCSFCVMNIVDKAHSAQYVTNKGKQFKFDAVECLVNALEEQNESELAFILVADYSNPGEMVNAIEATYLISQEIKSPMGANLSAIASEQKAYALKLEHTGAIYSWDSLKSKFKND
jgi:copper chaperone NosL